MSNKREPEQEMPPALREAMEKELAKVEPMITDSAAQPSFDEGGPAYQARADQLQVEFQEAWKSRIRAAYHSQVECPGAGLSNEWFESARFNYIINFIFPRGTVERLILEIGWERFVAAEWDKLPETVKKVKEQQESAVRRQLLLDGAQRQLPQNPFQT